MMMKKILPVILIPFLLCSIGLSCSSQSSKTLKEVKVGGPCEGCEAIFESPVSFDQLPDSCYLPDWYLPGPKLSISGTVYRPDGTPAPGVVLYIYHTNQAGIYPKNKNETGWGQRHGYLRGWLKTNKNGAYRFFTLRPASYPNSAIPAHIHITIKEPETSAYYIDEFLFDDDPFLTLPERNKLPGRGGNGILQLEKKENILYGIRDILLGKNIPVYPTLP